MGAVWATEAEGRITRISRGAFSCYVVHDAGAGRALVVDPGTPSNGVDAAATVHRLHGVTSTAEVVCTHGHLDHVGGVARLCELAAEGYRLPAPCEAYLAGAEVPAAPGPREIAKILPVLASHPFSLAALRELAPLQKDAGHSAKGMVMPLPPAGFLHDGEQVPGTSGWEVLAAPGHTGDSTCFYHRATATLLSGDAVLTCGGRAWFNPEITSAADSERTEQRLRGLPVQHLLPGHGLPVSGDDLLRHTMSFHDQPRGRTVSCLLSRSLGAWKSALRST